MKKLYSNEIVFRGHPDKVCDQISGAILDKCLKLDPNARVGVEVMGGKGKVFITGEITINASFDDIGIETIAGQVMHDCGYDWSSYSYENNVGVQSPDIAQGVDTGGAGDNGMMFGYACNDTPEMLPTAMVILQRFAKGYDELRQSDPAFKADGKAQITGEYDENFKLKRIKTFTICYQNNEINRERTDCILTGLANTIAADYGILIDEFLINPTGKFRIGGFEGDAGLTGRKIVVDAYQSFANVGGGCMNGKDPSKVDLTGAHYAREIAKDILKNEPGTKWCEVQVSYAIGRAEPLAVYILTNKGAIEPTQYAYTDGTPKAIIDRLKMKELCYEELAKFGHFRQ